MTNTLSELAIRGGSPACDFPWPAWPIHDETEERAMREVIRSGKWWYGDQVQSFEADFAATVYRQVPTVTYASAVHVALVEVDVETGVVRLLRYVVSHDCGHIINPMIVDGQIRGGVAQGIGGGLYEEFVYSEDGQLLSGSFLDYLVPTAAEVPPIDLVHLEYPSPRNPLGIKGVGEGGAISPPAAIANAVEDALRPFNVCVRETPLSPERVRNLITSAT